MKPDTCAVCGRQAGVHHRETRHGALYGCGCDSGHYMEAEFGTKRHAIAAWNECQRFVERMQAEGADAI